METLIILLLVILDQFSKGLVERHIGTGGSVPVIKGFFNLICTYNKGAAWSFLAGKSWGIVVLSIISALVMGILMMFLRRVNDKRAKAVLILIIAGSAGNLIDRVRMTAVTDFFSFTFGKYVFPAFNVADSLITIGAILLILFTLFDRRFLDKVFPVKRRHRSK